MDSPYIGKKPQGAFVSASNVKTEKCDSENNTFFGRRKIGEVYQNNYMTELIGKTKKNKKWKIWIITYC